MAIAWFVARQDISVDFRDRTCAGITSSAVGQANDWKPRQLVSEIVKKSEIICKTTECRQLGSSRRRRSVAGQPNADKPHYVKLNSPCSIPSREAGVRSQYMRIG